MIELRLLGPPALADTDGVPLAIAGSQPKRLALLAYLAVAQPRGAHSRDTIIGMFWPDLNDVRARAALNQSLYALRRVLGADAVLSIGDDKLRLASDRVRCDVVAFEDLLTDGSLEAALDQYGGPLLEGFFLSDVPDFEHWVDTQRMRLQGRAAAAAWKVADNTAEGDDGAAALSTAQRARLIGQDLDEPALRRVIELYDRIGDRSGAIREYETFAARFEVEFGSEPSPETVELIEQVRAREIAHHELMIALPELTVPARRAFDADAPWYARVRTIAVSAAIVIIALGSWAFLHDPPSRGGIAIFPFAYSGADATAHLADGVARLISANLNGVADLMSVDPNAVANAAARATSPMTATNAARMAAAFDAELVVVGRVVAFGDKVRINATLFPRLDVDARTEAAVEGRPDQIFELVDQLTTRLLAARTNRDLFRSASRTTSSPAALRAYVDGERSYQAGRHDEAAASFLRAVEIDTTFALAFLRLSQAGNWIGRPQLAEVGAAGATRNAHRLAPSDRLQVLAWDRYLKGDVVVAERTWREVLQQDSSNIEAWAHLAEIGFHWGPSFGRPSADSRAQWERVLSLSPLHIHALQHLSRIAAQQQRLPAFDSLAARINAHQPSVESIVELQALRAFSFGDRASRVAAADRLAPLPDLLRTSILHTAITATPDLADAAELLAPVVRLGRTFHGWEAGEMVIASGIRLARGQQRAADALLDSAALLEAPRVVEYRAAALLAQLTPPATTSITGSIATLREPAIGPGASYMLTPAWRAYIRATLAIRAGLADEAKRSTAELNAMIAPGDSTTAGRFARVFLRLVQAEQLRARRQPAAALAALGEPEIDPDNRLPRIWTYHRRHERFLRAELLAELGRSREALRWYATFPDPTAYDLAWLPAAEFRQAQILAGLGDHAAAEQHVRRLKKLYASADPIAAAALDSLLATLPGPARASPRKR